MRRKHVVVVEQRYEISGCELESGVGVRADAPVLDPDHSDARVAGCGIGEELGARMTPPGVRNAELEFGVRLVEYRLDALAQDVHGRVEARDDDGHERPQRERQGVAALPKQL